MSLSVVTPIAAAIVAAFVAYVGLLQWRISREKMRLELYNRRYEIYTRVLDIYQELMGWKDTPEQIALIIPFHKAIRESRFMFSEKSGVYRHLEEMGTHAFYVFKFAETRNSLSAIPEMQAQLVLERMNHVNWLLTSMATLEAKMLSTLRFDKI